MSLMRVHLILIIGLLSGCTSLDVWQTAAEISPVSYNLPGETLDRTVGRLRRLAIIPGEFKSRNSDLFDPPTTSSGREIGAEELRSTIISEAVSMLSGERDYDVQRLDPSRSPDLDDATLEGLLEKCSQDLIDWASAAKGGAASPAKVESCVKQIGRRLNVDGLLVIGGSRKSDRDWRFALTLLTASLAWPTLMVQEQIEASADVFEVSSGQIVWRSRFSKSAAEPTAPSVVVGFLFENFEHALPEVLID